MYIIHKKYIIITKEDIIYFLTNYNNIDYLYKKWPLELIRKECTKNPLLYLIYKNILFKNTRNRNKYVNKDIFISNLVNNLYDFYYNIDDNKNINKYKCLYYVYKCKLFII